ncbi:hypothetical protein D5400_09645 [Georhizobium profundi]|jgi:hypothetical protein|uniref:Lipoprotein n=1 Tax=Georhizobium profundi TaxID=2341112 RepID=A0A3Q8XNC3_9HYPH|nr:hypothetical protein [Georhizobium profundi]AZN71494.1 hypothetical protein D5400_09645 [Georhizobium profundi]
MKLTIALAALPLVVSGCAATTPPEVTAALSPASAYAVQPLHHHNAIGDYTHRVATDPRPWRNSNDAQAPGGNS